LHLPIHHYHRCTERPRESPYVHIPPVLIVYHKLAPVSGQD
jgi:hypothetical protein